MGVVSNYLERGKSIGLKFQKFANLSIVINILAIYNCLQVVDTARTSELSKLMRRDWDFGDTNSNSSSFPPFSTSNKPNSLVKQRKMHPYSTTSYAIINSTKTEPEATIDLLFGRERPDSSSKENATRSDFQRNLEELKKVVKARQKLIKRRSNITGNDSGVSKLEDNINTINVLIGMLMLANSKLIEQRDKMSPNLNSERITDSFKEDKRGYINKLEESLASSHITSQAEPRVSRENTTKSQDQGVNSTSTALTKPKKFKTNKNVISLKEPPKGENITQNYAKETDSADHFSVKPGFDSDDATHENSTSENNVPSEAQYSGMLFANPASVWNRKDFLRSHKPIVAHDLLHVRPHTHSNPTLPIYSRPLRPENMFVSHTPMSRPPISGIYEHLNPNRQQVDHGSPIQSLKRIPIEDDNVGSRDDEQQQQQRMVPPYNVHNVGWPLLTADNPHLIQAQFKEYPISPQRLGEEHQYNRTPKPAVYPPAMQNNPNLGSVGDDELRNQQPFISPLHQVLMAARNQQAAALELERRRLEHEMEIQKRQQQMKKQHEDNLNVQRLAHDERQKAAQNSDNDQKQQQQQQQQNSENQSGGPENQEDNQNQQQQGGNQDQNEDSGQDQNSVGQQGGNEGGNSREDDKDMKNFQDFAGDTDFTDLFPPGILSDAEIKEMRKQHQEQKQREQEEREEEQARQRQGSDEEQQGNGEDNGSGQEQQPNGGSDQQQELGEQTEQQNNRTQEEEVRKQPENSFGNRVIPSTITSNNNSSPFNNSSISMTNNHTTKSQVAEPKYNATMSKNSPPKLMEGLQTSPLKSPDSQTTKTPRLYVPNFLNNNNNSNIKNGLVGQIERSKLGQQPVVTSKRRRSHHFIPSSRGMTSSQAINDEPSSNQIIILDSEYQDKYMKPYMSISEGRKADENQEEQKPAQLASFSGEEEVSSESSFVDFEDQIDSKR